MRDVLVVVGIVAVLGGAAWLLAPDAAPPRDVGVVVWGPEGEWFNGTVHAKGTAADAIVAVAAANAWPIDIRGQGEQWFLVALRGVANSGDGGWCFAVWDDGWVYPGTGATTVAGTQFLWEYRPAGCPGV